jgi:hypothetical protein
MAEHDPEKLKAFWEYMETWKTLAKGLVLFNAAGLGYCITVLNSAEPRYRVGQFIALFVAGILFAGLYFLILTILKAEVTTAIVAQQRPGLTFRGKLLEYAGLTGMWGTILAPAAAVVLLAYRFGVL